MTTPNPWERLREAAEKAVEWRDGASTRKVADLPAALHDAIVDMREALAALPATPPQQPVTTEQAARVERGPSADDQRPKLLRGSASDPGANPGGGAIPSPAEKPAPASDWRERFEASRNSTAETLCLRDGLIAAEDRLAALEAEVENLRSQVLP